MNRKKIQIFLVFVIRISALVYISLNFQSKFIIKDNVLLEYKRGILADIMPNKEIVIPEGVTEIREYTFDGCKELKSIVIPDSVVKINGCAFMGCKSLVEIRLPKNLTEINSGTSSNCFSILILLLMKNYSFCYSLFLNKKYIVSIFNSYILKYLEGFLKLITLPKLLIIYQ